MLDGSRPAGQVTEIAFHFNAPDRVSYICRLLRKAVGSGAKVIVSGSPDDLQKLDEALWTFSATDFVPHCYLQAGDTMVTATPVLLAPDSADTELAPHHQVLLNLGTMVARGFDKFERVIEVVGFEDADRASARQRWKHYVEQGYAITRHDLTLRNEQA
jgi:DNA polymerase-3 subunit chi